MTDKDPQEPRAPPSDWPTSRGINSLLSNSDAPAQEPLAPHPVDLKSPSRSCLCPQRTPHRALVYGSAQGTVPTPCSQAKPNRTICVDYNTLQFLLVLTACKLTCCMQTSMKQRAMMYRLSPLHESHLQPAPRAGPELTFYKWLASPLAVPPPRTIRFPAPPPWLAHPAGTSGLPFLLNTPAAFCFVCFFY